MRAIELKGKSSGELRALLRERRLRAEELVLARAQRKSKNPHELRGVRRDIARIHTLLRQSKP